MRFRAGSASALIVLVTAVLTGGCSGSSAAPVLTADPGSYLITLGQLTSPDFSIYQPVAAVGAGWLDEESAAAPGRDGFERAATVEYYRPVGLATSNGPITLIAAVARFATSEGAAAGMTRLDTALDGRFGAVALPTGSLRDGHATTVQGTLGGVAVVEISVVWRVDNLLDSLVAQGRLGGLQLGQLLPLATSQTANELRKG